MSKPVSSQHTDTLELGRLADEVARLNAHRFVRVHNSIPRLIGFQFLRGLAFGLGTAIGATALVSVVVLVLSQIEFVPIIGSLAGQVIDEIANKP
ncbi:MAG: DUF5665 domain-containing protein [Pelagimonas sp.]|uniref:DUF5665 domain-containing protein n=1 Tax=Pelagimonas sp. TaxID=2073170 RepID=UPI003D6AF99C